MALSDYEYIIGYWIFKKSCGKFIHERASSSFENYTDNVPEKYIKFLIGEEVVNFAASFIMIKEK
ncbi:hypothetical protein GCM10008934_24260 [Virgibacillus salarius]